MKQRFITGIGLVAFLAVCLWLPTTSDTRTLVLDGKYFTGGGNTNNVFSIASGTDEPSDRIVEDGKGKWRVTVPALVAGATTEIAGLEEAGVSSVTAAPDGRGFVYLPDGDYAFSAGGFDYTVTVDGAAATAQLLRFGVTVDGVDASALSGDGWAFVPEARVIALTAAGPFAISGSGTNVGIRADADCAVTLENLSITNDAAGLAPFDCGSSAVAMGLSGTNLLVASGESAPVRSTT